MTDFAEWTWGDDVDSLLREVHASIARVVLEEVKNEIGSEFFLAVAPALTVSVDIMGEDTGHILDLRKIILSNARLHVSGLRPTSQAQAEDIRAYVKNLRALAEDVEALILTA